MFSVATEKDARDLLVAACQTNVNGEFVAKELIHEQTLENLDKFSVRLEKVWNKIQEIRSQ